MAKSSSGKTTGERLFELYLREHEIRVEYQPKLDGRKRPDYRVRSAGVTVLSEISDFQPGELDKPVAAQLEANKVELPGGYTGSYATGVLSRDAVDARIRGKVQAELEQLGEFRGRYPLAVVLHNPGTMTHLDDLSILSAMSGFLIPELNRGLSALIVVKTEHLGRRIHQQVLRGRRNGEGRVREESRRKAWPTTEEVVADLEALDEENRAWGGALTEEHGALRIYHNSYALIPLPAEVFPAPHVSHARLIPDPRDRKGETLKLQEIRLRVVGMKRQ